MGSRHIALFLARRLLAVIPVLAALVIATFLMVRLIPGDPALLMAGPNATVQQIADIHKQLGLDRPLIEQFWSYLGGLIHGHLGESFLTTEPVTTLLKQNFPATLQLAGVSLAAVLLLGIPFGVLAGALTQEHRHRRLEVLFTGATSVLGSLPEYLAATFLAAIFAVWLRLLPVAGNNGLHELVLPVVALTIRPVASISRIVRLETLNVLAQDYIRTARSKRLPTLRIYLHVFPNIVTPVLTVAGVLFAGLIGGTVLVENVFARQGLGTLLVSSVISHDYVVVQGAVLWLGFMVITVNAVIDILLGIADPRSLIKAA